MEIFGAVLFGMFLGALSALMVVVIRLGIAEHKAAKFRKDEDEWMLEEDEKCAKFFEEFSEEIDHTEILAATEKDTVYRIHFKDGTVKVGRIDRRFAFEKVCLEKVV